MKNVLFIVYYFPPMGGSGVQRPLKFAKYLRDFGWNPIILCPEPGAYHTFDDSLQTELDGLNLEIHRVKASTPFHFLSGNKQSRQVSISDKKSRLLRKFSRLLFFPDNKKGWIEPAIKKGMQLIEEKNIKTIFSSAPPFSNHVVGRDLKKKSELPLVLDYRDSWTNNHFMTDLMGWQKRIAEKMEKSCINEADLVLGLDRFMLKQIKNQSQVSSTIYKVLPHGFDPEDFEIEKPTSFNKKEGKLNILYSGLFYEANQPDVFLKAIRKVFEGNPGWSDLIHLHFQGGLDERIIKLINELDLSDHVNDYGYVTHREAVQNVKKTDLLWMISNFSPELKQIKSGKLFEYIGSRIPILGLVHEGVASDLLEEYGTGFSASPISVDQVSSKIEEIFKLWESNSLPETNEEFVQQFNRRSLSQNLASLFDVISH